MEDFKTLKIVDLFKGIYTRFGIDYRIMRKILQTKLTMDQRRVSTIVNNASDEGSDMFTKSLLIYMLIGLFIGFVVLLPFPLFFKMNIFIGMVLFMVMTAMISDYSAVLLDIVEKNILLPKPIDLRTYNAAKTTHIYIYLFKIIFAISLPGVVIGSFKHGLTFAILYLPQMILIAALVIFFTSILYYIILHFFDGEKLKDIINYFQIFLAALTFMIYQLIGKAFQLFDVNISFTPTWWSYLLPSAWFAAPYSMLLEGNNDGYYLIFSILGVIIPIALLIIYYVRVANIFEMKLQKLNTSSNKIGDKAEKRSRRQRAIARILCKNKVEGTFYKFTQNMIGNERALKLKLYPSLAMAALMPLVFLMRTLDFTQGLRAGLDIIRQGSSNILYLYFTSAILGTSSAMISTTEKYKAAWIYDLLPIDNPAPIFKGAIKAFIVKLIGPIFLVASIIFTGLFGVRVLPDIILVFLNTILLIIVIQIMGNKALPFSQNFEAIKHSSMSVFFGTSMLCGGMAGAHWFFLNRGINLGIYILVTIIVIAFLWLSSLNKLKPQPNEQ